MYEDFFRIAQIIALLLFIPVFHYMILVYKQEKKWKLFTLAFGFLLLSTIFAILRGFFAFDIYRLLEHLSILIASVILTYACYHSYVYLYSGEVE